MEKSNYALKNGVVFNIDDTVISCTYITDEYAEEILRQDKKNIRFFAYFPDDWKERIKVVKIEKKEETKPIKEKKQIKIDYKWLTMFIIGIISILIIVLQLIFIL